MSPLDIKEQLIYGTGNIVYKFKTAEASKVPSLPDRRRRRYNAKPKGDDVPSGSVPRPSSGINAGAGFDIKAGAQASSPKAAFTMCSPMENLKFIPITVGVRFGGIESDRKTSKLAAAIFRGGLFSCAAP